ncbi:MAG: zf-HC2 domain-containing protein [Planctomycetes bacterium]|nr:zf-HC2 domain-containing protein [Planctomycetota bacterium]
MDEACREIREDLIEKPDGTLSAEKERRIEGHIERCAECRAFAADLTGLAGAMSALARREEKDLAPLAARRPSLARRLVLAAGILVLAAAAFTAGRTTAPRPPVPEPDPTEEPPVVTQVVEIRIPAGSDTPALLAGLQAARTALARGDEALAGECLDQVARVAAGSAPEKEARGAALLAGASAEAAAGRTAGARSRVQEFRSADPASPALGPTLAWLAEVEAGAGEWDQSARHLADALAAGVAPLPEGTVRLAFGGALEKAGRVEKAREAYLDASRAPGAGRWGTEARLALARLDLGRRGDLAEAERTLRELEAAGVALPPELERLLLVLQDPGEREALQAYVLAQREGAAEYYLDLLVREHPESEATRRLFAKLHPIEEERPVRARVERLGELASRLPPALAAYSWLVAGDLLAVDLEDRAAAKIAYEKAARLSTGRLGRLALALSRGEREPGSTSAREACILASLE